MGDGRSFGGKEAYRSVSLFCWTRLKSHGVNAISSMRILELECADPWRVRTNVEHLRVSGSLRARSRDRTVREDASSLGNSTTSAQQPPVWRSHENDRERLRDPARTSSQDTSFGVMLLLACAAVFWLACFAALMWLVRLAHTETDRGSTEFKSREITVESDHYRAWLERRSFLQAGLLDRADLGPSEIARLENELEEIERMLAEAVKDHEQPRK
jgi:hypothetical protein